MMTFDITVPGDYGCYGIKKSLKRMRVTNGNDTQ